MPCHIDPRVEEHARLVVGLFGIQVEKVDLGPLLDVLLGILPDVSALHAANLKPPLRTSILYYFSNRLRYLVVGSGNKSELATGYFTKYGDGGADILPLGGLLKSELRELARELGVPN